LSRIAADPAIYLGCMASNNTLLCIHREPTQLALLQDSGYELISATNGHDGLRLFMSSPVDAIVLEYHLGLLDGSVIASTIKQIRPAIPIVMLSDHLELPDDALKSVDALVTKSDGVHFLLATVHFLLNVKPAKRHAGQLLAQMPVFLRPRGRSNDGPFPRQTSTTELSMNEKDEPLSPSVWRNIRNGNIRF
jgi:DNA-binding response OmpR family regulator